MPWNWQQCDWPDFTWDGAKLTRAETLFAEGAGVVIGASGHLDEDAREALTVEVMSLDAVDSSAIEGEVLDQDSVQSSLRRHLGLAHDNRRPRPAEAGMAEMMASLYRGLKDPLTHEMLHGWHAMIMTGRTDLKAIGAYRSDPEPMQIVSGPVHAHKVHFEAPPSDRVPKEMERFLAWFAGTAPGGKKSLPPVTRAGIAHLWFESIHPFEDGNGRIGRAVSEKALAEALSAPVLTAIAGTLLKRRKDYYRQLELASQDLAATDWLLWFASAVIEAQRRGRAQVEFVLAKARMMDRIRSKLNPRQEKALLRLFAAGPDGFEGGLSAGNYMTITGAPPATATRDLGQLVEMGALIREGTRKATRYCLVVPVKPVETVTIADIS